jgi:hypothetical protein
MNTGNIRRETNLDLGRTPSNHWIILDASIKWFGARLESGNRLYPRPEGFYPDQQSRGICFKNSQYFPCKA